MVQVFSDTGNSESSRDREGEKGGSGVAKQRLSVSGQIADTILITRWLNIRIKRLEGKKEHCETKGALFKYMGEANGQMKESAGV